MPVGAQSGPISYAEDRTDPVATFTATDPEEKDITWSLATGGDAEDFKISNGVLTFANQPNYEAPADADTNNTYTVTVVASAGADTDDAIRTVTREVTVNVTNVDEPGSIMLSTLQPQVGVPVVATLSDSDTRAADGSTTTITPTWQWYRGSTEIPGATADTFTPSTGDVGFLLSVAASYDDAEGDDKSAMEPSAHPVRAAPASNIAPVFPDEDVADTAVLIKPRAVDENTASGENIGSPIAATDPGDILTYAFAGSDTTGTDQSANEANFSIDRATGQIITKGALNHEATASYIVNVTATDPFGVSAEAAVTINVTDLNEAPTITRTTPLAAAISFAENGDITAALATYAATDVDQGADDSSPDTLTWSATGADAGKFYIGNQTGGTPGVLTFKAQPNYESPGDADGDNDYDVTVVVGDGNGNSDEHSVTITITNVEETGTVTISTLQPRVGVELSASLTDPDGDISGLMWQWYDGTFDAADPTTNAIEDATSAAYTPVAGDLTDTLTAVATYKDGAGTNTDVQSAAAAAPVIADRRPKAPEFPDQDMETEGPQTDQTKSVDEGTASGTNIDDGNPVAATDANPGDTLTYTLGGPDAASFDIVAATGQLQTKAALDHETKDSYSITVTATDSLNLTATVNVTIEVNDIDEAPELDGDATAMFAENGTGPVATYTAMDPEEKDIVWTLGGGDAADFSIDGGVLEFDSPPNFEDDQGTGSGANEYIVIIQASAGASTDAAIQTATLEVTVTVTDEDEPGTITLSTLQPQVGVQVTAELTDGDTITTSTVSWTWYRGTTPISGSASSGQATATYTPEDGDVGNRLRAVATYDDSEGEDKTAQEDSVRPIRRAPATNTSPVFPDQNPGLDGNQTDQEREIAENTPAGRNIGVPVRATDPGDVLTYSFAGAANATDEANFDIDRATGQIITKGALNHDAVGGDEYTVTVTATDPWGVEATANVTIEVTDLNEPPTITGDPAATLSFAEDGDVATALATYTATDQDEGETATLTWSVTGDDAGEFDISNAGALTFDGGRNYESPADADGDNDYDVTVVATDAEGNTDEHDVTVTVTNVEEAGSVSFSTLQPRVGVEITATLSDPDGSITNLMWQWSSGGTDIEDATSATYTPVSGNIGSALTAVPTYKDGAGTNDDTVTTGNTTANSVIADIRNKAPVFPDQDDETDGDQTDQEREIAEGTASEQNIGDPVTATDNQFDTVTSTTPTADTLTYTLGGTDAASFSINRTTAQLQTKAALDHEDKDTYMVTVTATDPSGLSATVNVTIEITDVDEPPMIMLGGLAITGSRNVSVAEGETTVATYSASGPNADMAMWDLSGDDAASFDIDSATGELTFKRTPDFETPGSAAGTNVYSVTVEADDGTYQATHDVTVTVTDVVETTPTDPLLARFDPNGDGRIEMEDMRSAVGDFFGANPTLSVADMRRLVTIYFTQS